MFAGNQGVNVLLASAVFAGTLVSAGCGGDSPEGSRLADAERSIARIERTQKELDARLDRLESKERSRADPADVRVQPTAVAGAAAPSSPMDELLPAGTPPERVAEAAAVAERIRRDAEARARGAEHEAARAVTEAMARERTLAEDAARGGTMALLRALSAKNARATELAASPERMEALFARHMSGPSRSEAAWKEKRPLEDGTTVTLGAGKHEWDVASYRQLKSFPKDVLVRGAGMDATILRLNELASEHEIHSLTFEDLTLDAGDDYLTDLRSESPITLRLRRCRVVAFDMGAGGSVMLAARTAAFYASDCRFEAGFGRTQAGFGNLFRVRDGLVARLERCTFNGPFRSVFDAGPHAAYEFVGCRFEEMPGFDKTVAAGADGVRFETCEVLPAQPPETPIRRRLQSINPGW